MIRVDPKNPRGLVWLASYPKSGNTWVRVFLYQLMRIMGGHPREDDELNQLDRSSMYEGRLFNLFEQMLGKPMAEISSLEIMSVRAMAHAEIVQRTNTLALIKTHNVLGHVANMPLINLKVSAGSIIIVRDPRDVAPSLAKHLGAPIDQTIDVMGKTAYHTTNQKEQVFEMWGSWSENVKSWTMQPSEAALVVRYEDLLDTPTETFGKIAAHLRQTPAEEQLLEAIELSSFDVLRKQEEDYDFRERSPMADRFFTSGKAGTWRERLTAAQAQRIVDEHGEMMAKFGYLNN